MGINSNILSNNLSLPILLFFFFYKISHILALSMHIVRLAFWFLQQQKFCCDFDWDFFQFIYQFRVNWLYSDFRSMNMVYSFSYFCIKSDCQYFPLRPHIICNIFVIFLHKYSMFMGTFLMSSIFNVASLVERVVKNLCQCRRCKEM